MIFLHSKLFQYIILFVGIGFDKEKNDQWVDHQDEFNNLLKNLQSNQVKTETDDDKSKSLLSGKSLEDKSKQSSARVQ